MFVGKIINQALLDIAAEQKNSVFFAQGISDPNGVFGTLNGLGQVVEAARLIEMPVAETGGIGTAIGLAIYGKRPVVSFHRVEFLFVALEQVFNNAAKAHFISGGSYSAPILIRLVVGRGWGQGPSHSQSIESVFSAIPGLKVVCPSLPSNAYDVIRNSFDDDAPVICIEHRWTHYAESQLPNLCERNDKFLGSKLVHAGGDATLVTYGFSVIECNLVVLEFAKHGISIDLIDLQVLRPLDLGPIYKSVAKTGKLIFVDQGHKTLGIGSEVVSRVTEHCFDNLKSKPIRLGLPDLPSPSSVALASDFYVSLPDISETIADVLSINENIKNSVLQALASSPDRQADVPNDKFKGPF